MRLCPICGGKMSPDEGGWFECNNDDHKYFCIRPDRKTYADRLAAALDAARKQVAKLEAEIEFRDRSWESRESQAKRCNELEANYALLNDDYKQAELSNKTLRAENAKLKAAFLLTTLKIFIEWSDHFQTVHRCDHHRYEFLGHAMLAAKGIVAEMSKGEAS